MTRQPEDLTVAGENESFLNLVNTSTQDALLADVKRCLEEKTGFTIATLNLDHIVKLRRDADFRAAYRRHSHVVADGNPIVWLRYLMGRPVELVPGSDLILPLARLAQETGTPVALIGSTEETLAQAAAKLEATVPGLRIVTQISPEFGFDVTGSQADDLLQQLKYSDARLVFLAFGAPKQEILAARGATILQDRGFVSIGAGLDFIAGGQRRAPEWMRRFALEWLWRVLSNPRRLLKRYAECFAILPSLVVLAVRSRLHR
ncbi:WecB/TagA/CpsF family glycosyltransferase [Roseovarius aestuariivivens]|uniref:WecB/TagA/CpsF family glycosyltransferase n=1 Tax=Roseovarius aestuariivivens TaxID=1888910 RepID=UPI001080F215|nr:WecB/TagA/CpsF family glycosyltransferase [Roseovarius aestuariivivens]